MGSLKESQNTKRKQWIVEEILIKSKAAEAEGHRQAKPALIMVGRGEIREQAGNKVAINKPTEQSHQVKLQLIGVSTIN